LVLTIFFLLFYGSQFMGLSLSHNHEINMIMMMTAELETWTMTE